jgi:hypothetical protein
LEEPYVQFLHEQLNKCLGQIEKLSNKVEELEGEIRKLKKLPKKPAIKPSNLDKDSNKNKPKGKRGAGKRKKKASLEIHEVKKIKITGLGQGWKRIGHQRQIRQDIIIRANNVEYLLEKWRGPNGEIQIAKLPDHLQNTHFGSTLKAYIIHQYYECGVTQPLIFSSLKDYGVDISSGQISSILTEDKQSFHAEKESLLTKGIELREELRTDDTGARHQFRNGFCNCINSRLFTYFTTTFSKSRINFLTILRGEREDYQINETSLDYVKHENHSCKYYKIMKRSYDKGQRVFEDKEVLQRYYEREGIKAPYAIRQITEALLIGSIVEHGFDPATVIHSDGAGQFNLFIHSLCWKHAERPLVKLKIYNQVHEEQIESKKSAYWMLYQSLKAYKKKPDAKAAFRLSRQFDSLCEPVVNYASLNQVLEKLKKNKDQLLVVLARPKTSLHNNDSERDIREYVKRRKISAGTRSENGRKARDTFLSLKKTCRKLEISFWDYLLDRMHNTQHIPQLSQVMAQKQQLPLG